MSKINKPECALRLLLAKSCPVVDEEGWSSHTVSLCGGYLQRIDEWKYHHVCFVLIFSLSELVVYSCMYAYE